MRLAVLGGLLVAAGACTHGTGATAAAVKNSCPGQLVQWLAHKNPTQLAAAGAADALPIRSATTRRSVTQAVARDGTFLRAHVSGVGRVSVGPGLGWTWRPTIPARYEHHPDYQVIAHVADRTRCPQTAWNLRGADEQRVPVQFVYDH